MTERAEFDVIAYLESKGFSGKRAGGEVAYPCFLSCDEPKQSRKRKLYVNPVTGMYKCFVCDDHGGTTLLLRFFGDDTPTGVASQPSANKRRILEQATARGAEYLWNDDDALTYLMGEKRGLTADTIRERQLGRVPKGWSLTDELGTPEELTNAGLLGSNGRNFFYDHLLIPYHHMGSVVQLRGRVPDGVDRPGGKYMTGPGQGVRLYNADALMGADEAILCEGEFDAMILAQHLALSSDDRMRHIGVVAIPGTSATPEGFEGYFSDVKRVYVAFDSDDPGRKASIRIKELLGSRARIVEFPSDLGDDVDWTEFFVKHDGSWRDVQRMLGEASGKRVFSVAEAGNAWRNQRALGTGVAVGFETLDAKIEPGLLPGQLVVVLAKTGAGKTVFLCNVAYATRDVPTLFISLEMTREEVYERLRRIYLFHHPLGTEDEIDKAFSQTMICDMNRLSEDDFAGLMDEYELETGVRPEIVMVDYLGYYARGMKGGSPYEKTSNAVMQLKAEAKKHRVVVISPHQVNRLAKEGKPLDMDDARDSGVVEETADFMLSLWRPDDALQMDGNEAKPTGRVKLTLLKSRHGNKGSVIDLQMDLLTLAMVDMTDPAARTATEHNYKMWRGYDYAALRREQTAPVQLGMGTA